MEATAYTGEEGVPGLVFGRVFGRVPGREAGEQLLEERGYTLLVVETLSGDAQRSSLPTGAERNHAFDIAVEVRGMGDGVDGDSGSRYRIVIRRGAMYVDERVDCSSVLSGVDRCPSRTRTRTAAQW